MKHTDEPEPRCLCSPLMQPLAIGTSPLHRFVLAPDMEDKGSGIPQSAHDIVQV